MTDRKEGCREKIELEKLKRGCDLENLSEIARHSERFERGSVR